MDHHEFHFLSLRQPWLVPPNNRKSDSGLEPLAKLTRRIGDFESAIAVDKNRSRRLGSARSTIVSSRRAVRLNASNSATAAAESILPNPVCSLRNRPSIRSIEISR